MSAEEQKILELSYACDRGQLEIVKRMVAAGTSVNATGVTAIFNAVTKSNDDVLWLLKNGANLNAVDHVGCNALFDAVEFFSIESMILPIAAGADVNARTHMFELNQSINSKADL